MIKKFIKITLFFILAQYSNANPIQNEKNHIKPTIEVSDPKNPNQEVPTPSEKKRLDSTDQKNFELDSKNALEILTNLTHKIEEFGKSTHHCSEPNKIENFSQLLEHLSPEENSQLCRSSKKELRKHALDQMNQFLTRQQITPLNIQHRDPNSPLNSETEFTEYMKKGWKKISEKLEETRKSGKLGKTKEESYLALTIEDRAESSIKSGFFPIPIDESVEKNIFTYSSLKKWFFLGLSPIGVRVGQTDLELSETVSHPFTAHDNVNGVVRFAIHDFDHTSLILSKHRNELNLEDPETCEQFQLCLTHLAEKTGKKYNTAWPCCIG